MAEKIEAGRVAYEARFEDGGAGAWEKLPAVARALWARVEAASQAAAPIPGGLAEKIRAQLPDYIMRTDDQSPGVQLLPSEWRTVLAALAREGEPRPGGGATKPISVRDYLDGYEFRGDGGDYTPTERELILLEDFGNGLLREVEERSRPDVDVLQRDLIDMLETLGLPTHARPQSPHVVFREALGVLKAKLATPPVPPDARPDAVRTASVEDVPWSELGLEQYLGEELSSQFAAKARNIRNLWAPNTKGFLEKAVYAALMHTHARAALASSVPAWRPISKAPKDRHIWVFAPGVESLNDIVCLCHWHDDAGFCVDELREPTLYQEALAPPPPADKAAPDQDGRAGS